MDIDEHVRAARRILSPETAAEVSTVYSGHSVFPERQVIEGPDDPERFFPGWDGAVLLLEHENQGACSWGLSLDGRRAGAVVVGGDLLGGVRTVVHTASLEEFVLVRRWDSRCLNREPLLQAQADPLDDQTLEHLDTRFRPMLVTDGWPCPTNLRYERDDVLVMLWSCADQCDWWISGPTIPSLRLELPGLRGLSDLANALWSDDEQGSQVLAAEDARAEA